MCAQIAPIDIPKSYRLLNVGGTTLISAKHNGKVDVMAATWACPLDFNAVSVVIAGDHYTRKLIKESGYFAVQLPTIGILDQVMKVGTISMNDDEDKIAHSGVELFYQDGYDIPLVKGCNGWLICKVIPEPHNDFIFSILAEELGFVGCAVVLILFAVFIWRGVLIAMKAPDMFGSLIAIGITSLVAIQVIINVAVVTSSMPATGMPLPFFSYRWYSIIYIVV